MSLITLAARRALASFFGVFAAAISAMPVVDDLLEIEKISEPWALALYLGVHAFILRFTQVMAEGLGRGEEQVRTSWRKRNGG